MPSRYNFTFSHDVTYNGVTYHKDDVYETDNPCEVLAIMDTIRGLTPGAGFKEGYKGVINDALIECPISNIYVSVINGNPGVQGQPVELKLLPGVSDSAESQGAPSVPISGTVREVSTPGTTDHSADDASFSSDGGDIPLRPIEGEKHPTHNAEQPGHQVLAGDPVDIFNGSFYLEITDLEIPQTLLPLAFSRFYRSGASAFGPLGWNWDHNFNMYLRQLANGDMVLWRKLHEETFMLVDDGYASPNGVPEFLIHHDGPSFGFELKYTNGISSLFEIPSGWTDTERIPIIRIEDVFGNFLEFEYGSENKLKTVRDDAGHAFSFTYDDCGLMVGLTDQAGRAFHYEHNEETMQLVCVTSPGISEFPDGIRKYYEYEVPYAPQELRNNIVRISDSEGRVYVENYYEPDPASWHFARLIEQYYGGYLFQYRYTHLQWTPSHADFLNIPSVQAEVMNPDFGVETYTFNYRGDLLDFRFRLVSDGSFRVVAHQYEYDSAGNQVIHTRPDGSRMINTFLPDHRDPRMRHMLIRKEITAAAGFPSPSRIVWQGSYNEEFQALIEEQDETGMVTRYRYDFDLLSGPHYKGILMEVEKPPVILANGQIQHAITRYEYNDRGQQTAIVHADGSKNRTVYFADGGHKNKVYQQIIDVDGIAATQETTYDSFGFPTIVRDAKGNVNEVINNPLGLAEQILLPGIDGASTTLGFLYDSNLQPKTIKKPAGSYVFQDASSSHIEDRIERDVLGYTFKVTKAINTFERQVIELINDFRGQPLRVINPDGSEIDRVYDERGLKIAETVRGIDGLTMQSKWVYDRSGKLQEEHDISGKITTYFYDGFSRLSKKILPNGSEIQIAWAANDVLISESCIGSDGFGAIRPLTFKTYMYDSRGRKIKEVLRAFTDTPESYQEIVTQFGYDSMDRLIETTTPYSGVYQYLYNTAGRLIQKTDPHGAVEKIDHDQNGNIIRVRTHYAAGDTSFIEKKYSYDARNRLVRYEETGGSQVHVKYDDRDLIIAESDFSGTHKEIIYNAHGQRIREVIDGPGLQIQHAWILDNVGRVVTYIDPTLKSVQIEYDGIGRRVKMLGSNHSETRWGYNEAGLIQKEELDGVASFTYTYDDSDRLLEIKNSFAAPGVMPVGIHRFQYDGQNRIVQAEVNQKVVTRKYDSLSRIVSETHHGQTISCVYQDHEKIVIKRWPNGRIEKWNHDDIGHLLSIKQIQQVGAAASEENIATFIRNGKLIPSTTQFSRDIEMRADFDNRDRLTTLLFTVRGQELQKVVYHKDINNRNRVENIMGINPASSYFEYDSRLRLSCSYRGFEFTTSPATSQEEHNQAIENARLLSHEGRKTCYAYDVSDVLLQREAAPNDPELFTYSEGYQLASVNGINLEFVNGILSSMGSMEYESDALGRIVAIRKNHEIIVRFTFDVFGRISEIWEKGKPDREFGYFGADVDHILEGGISKRQITRIPGTGVPVAFHGEGQTFFPLFDGRNNLIALLDDEGNVLETYRYDDFGAPSVYNPVSEVIPESAYGIAPIFGGQEFLQHAELYISKRRLYDPYTGIYLSPDPSGVEDSPSPYVYCAQNPIDNTDPNGDFLPLLLAGLVLGGLGGLGYSVYDDHRHGWKKYKGWGRVWGYTKNIVGGAAIGGTTVIAGEVIAAAGTHLLTVYTVAPATTSLSAGKAFLLYGASSSGSGFVLKTGLHYSLPESVGPPTASGMLIDFGTGGAVGAFVNKIAPLTIEALSGKHQGFYDWFKYWNDKGGASSIVYEPAKYIQLGDDFFEYIPEEYFVSMQNFDEAGSWFARISTHFHEWLHHSRDLKDPAGRLLFRENLLSGDNATLLFKEEMMANILGSAFSLRPHGILGAFSSAKHSLGSALMPVLNKTGQFPIGDLPGIGNKMANDIANRWLSNFLFKVGLIGAAPILMGSKDGSSGKK